MQNDERDLLGGTRLPIVRRRRFWGLQENYWLQFALVLVVLALVWSVRTIRQQVFTWQEKRIRLQKRRKHGIPDSDRRPFNVAYAAAVHAREEREAEKRAHEEEEKRLARTRELQEKEREAVDGLRHRGKASTIPSPTSSSTMFSQTGSVGHEILSEPINFVQRLDSKRGSDSVRFAPLKPKGSVQDILASPGPVLRKHSLEEKDGLAYDYKKSRLDGRDLVGRDDEAHYHDNSVANERKSGNRKSNRGSKRHADSVDEDVDSVKKSSREKRARKVSREKRLSDADQLMEVDKSTQSGDKSRGKKRDRTDADSPFAGDEEPGETSHSKKSQRRKKNVGEEANRGKKRSFATDPISDSEDEGQRATGVLRKKGKHMASEDESEDGVSLDGSTISVDPACKGHKIGEEWESNGQRWKVGRDGMRLRQALIRKKRSRFSMPRDSQHPDSQAQMVVLIEKWLTDAEYKAAEDNGDLFIPSKEPEPEKLGVIEDVEESPNPKSGKPLFWSTTVKRANSVSRKVFRDSMVSNIDPDFNPFEQPPSAINATYGRRVSSGHAGLRSPMDTSKLRQSKTYSKWEKQDMEAESMAKLRKKLEEQKKAVAAEKALSQPAAPPSILVTAPSLTSTSQPTAALPAPSNSLFAPPKADTTVTPPPPAQILPASSTSPALTPFPTSHKSSDSTGSSPFAFAPPAQNPAPAPPTISVIPPSRSSSSTPATAPPVPNFFANSSKVSAPTTAASTPVPNFFGKPASDTPPQPAAPANDTKTLFKFGTQPSAPTSVPTSTGSSSFQFGNPTPGSVAGLASSPFGQTSASTQPTQGSAQQESKPSSLLSRLGGGGDTSSVPPPSLSPFSFGNRPTTPTPNTANTTPAAPAPSPPKFNFGFSAAPAANGKGPTTQTQAPTQSLFSFGGDSSSVSKHSTEFGQPSAPQSQPNSMLLPKPATPFGGLGSSPLANSTSSTTPTFTFGTKSPLGSGGAFGPAITNGNANTSVAKETPKTLFAFGNNNQTGSFNSNQSAPTTNGNTPSNAPASGSPFAFNFSGGSSNSAPTPAFGAFGGGAKSASAGVFTFGSKPGSDTSKQ